MSAVLARARVELRTGLRSWVGLALLVGLAAGAVMAAAAGARRTDTAYARFERAARAADVFVPAPFSPDVTGLDMRQVARLPQVATAALVVGYPTTDPSINVVAPADDRFGVIIDRPKLLAGRLPRADRPDEAAVSFTLARRRHLSVGSRLTIGFAAGPLFGPPSGLPVAVTFRVVGVEASPGDFPPQVGGNNLRAAHLSRAFPGAHPRFGSFGESTVVRLRRGRADIPAFEAGLRRLARGEPEFHIPLFQQAANVQRSIHLQSVALWLVAGLLALVSLLVLSQLLARQSFLEAVEHPTLRALGMTSPQLWGVGVGRAAATGLVGALSGVIAAVLASPLLPLGTARTAEPHPGLAADATVLGLGALATVSLVVMLAALPGWRQARRRVGAGAEAGLPGGERPALLARVLGSSALSPSVGVGVRMAVEPGRGRTAVPVRSTLAGVTLAVAALVGALTFGDSLNRLLRTPRLYGWAWDAYLTPNGPEGIPTVVASLQRDPRIAAVALADTGLPLAIDRVRTEGLAFGPLKGRVTPVLVAGRVPTADDEVALGTKTLRALHKDVGDRVQMRITVISPSRPVAKRVVGRVVLPALSEDTRFGVGVFMTLAGEQQLIPSGVTAPPPSDLVLRFAPGVDRRRMLAEVRRQAGDYTVFGQQKPTDVVNFGQVQGLPVVLAGLLGLLAAATLTHTLVTSVRRRQRDLAVMKTLGFSPRQVRGAVGWQATTLASLALLIGVPLGVFAGRWAWRLFANQLGTVPEPSTPGLVLLLTVPAVIVLANLVAAGPGFAAARTRPALVLRAE